jgi:hypothetical protein
LALTTIVFMSVIFISVRLFSPTISLNPFG